MALPAVRREVNRFDPHVVSAHFVPNYGLIAALARFSPWVLSTWGSDIMVLPGKSAFHMARTRFVVRRATFITSDAEVMTKRLVELGASPDRVVTFPYGVDRKVFHPAAPSVPGDAPRVICNRKMEPVYDVGTLVAAFAEVASVTPGAHLTLAGSGSEKRALENRARSCGADHAVSFVGNVPHRAVPDLLRNHDIFVSAALSDTTSVSLLEAMACGLFPVVSDIPANREWIEDGSNGFVVPTGDIHALARAITEAWRNRDLRETAKQKNADLIEARADWYRNMSVVDDLFRRLAGPRMS
jgi:glycosyltransferase involved in cell wall biosynthesis